MKQNMFHNNVFMALLSIVIIVAIVFMVVGVTTSSRAGNDSAGGAYANVADSDIYSYQDAWTDHPITRNNRMHPLPEQYQ